MTDTVVAREILKGSLNASLKFIIEPEVLYYKGILLLLGEEKRGTATSLFFILLNLL